MNNIDKIAYLMEAEERGRFNEMREILEAAEEEVSPLDVFKSAFSSVPGSKIESGAAARKKYAQQMAAVERAKAPFEAYKQGRTEFGRRRRKNRSAAEKQDVQPLIIRFARDDGLDRPVPTGGFPIFTIRYGQPGNTQPLFSIDLRTSDISALQRALPVLDALNNIREGLAKPANRTTISLWNRKFSINKETFTAIKKIPIVMNELKMAIHKLQNP